MHKKEARLVRACRKLIRDKLQLYAFLHIKKLLHYSLQYIYSTASGPQAQRFILPPSTVACARAGHIVPEHGRTSQLDRC